jgi:hypothetical protein
MFYVYIVESGEFCYYGINTDKIHPILNNIQLLALIHIDILIIPI